MFEDLLTFSPSFRDYKQVHFAPTSRVISHAFKAAFEPKSRFPRFLKIHHSLSFDSLLAFHFSLDRDIIGCPCQGQIISNFNIQGPILYFTFFK